MSLTATILIDNIAQPPLVSEWGLSLYIEYNGNKILLDAGTTAAFADNAKELGIELSKVEYAVLSHAHYDHANGFDRFFEINDSAMLHIRSGAAENCYSGEGADRHYIGVRQGMLTDYSGRIKYADGIFPLCDGAYLVPHSRDMSREGENGHLYLLKEDGYIPDTLAHEQSLVFETEKGLVIFNSCCHGGGDVIIREVSEMLSMPVYALIGGLHLFRLGDSEVSEIAKRLQATGVERIYTGHCTGQHGFELLGRELGDRAVQIYTGMNIHI